MIRNSKLAVAETYATKEIVFKTCLELVFLYQRKNCLQCLRYFISDDEM
jgi:hypothetical protein